MKLNTKMPDNLNPFYVEELVTFDSAWSKQEIATAWHHLERAHIISQRYPLQHTETHWKMFLLGIKTTNLKEIVGQLIRLIFGAPLSFINKIPVGNVGSSRVSMIQSQPLPADIQEIFEEMET